MGDLSKHFSRHEFKCHCSDQGLQHCRGSGPISMELVLTLEYLRHFIAEQTGQERPIRVHSGFRCIPWNSECGGVPGSQHVLALAADISVQGLSAHELMAIVLDVQGFNGYGEYGTFVHLDLGPSRPSWDFSGNPDRDVLHDVP